MYLQDEKYDYIEIGDVDKVKKCLNEKSEWYEKNMNVQNQLKFFENLIVLVFQIMFIKKVCESYFIFINFFDYFGVMNIFSL